MLKRIAILATSVAVLAACNDTSSTNDPAPSDGNPQSSQVTASGRVADGYLVGAKICLDLDRNCVCNAGEPSTTSTAGGEYSLNATQAQLDTYNVLVEVTTTTVDEDTGETVPKAYKLTTPVGKNEFISPITTLVQGALANNPALSLEDAESQLNESLNVGSDDLYDDFIQNSNLENLHKTAQVTAAALGQALEQFDGAASGSSDQVQTEMMLIANDIVSSKLNAIVTAVLTSDPESFNVDTIVTNTVSQDISDTTEYIDEKITEKTDLANAEAVTPKSAYDAGISYIDTYLINDELDDQIFGFEQSTVFSTSDGVSYLTECSHKWNLTTNVDNGEICETHSVNDEFQLDSPSTQWVVNDEGILTNIEYDKESYGARWIDDETSQYYEELKLDGSVVHSQTKNTHLGNVKQDLTGKNIVSAIKAALVNTTEQKDYGLDFHSTVLDYMDDSVVFSENAASYLYSVISTDTFPHFSNWIHLTDSSLVTLEAGTATVDDIIDNNWYVFADCVGESDYCDYGDDFYSFLVIRLNSSTGATAGNATIYQYVQYFDETPSTVSDAIFTFQWKKATRYGHPAIVFDTSKEKVLTDLKSIISVEDGLFVQEFPHPADTGMFVCYNGTVMDDIKQLIADAVENYIISQSTVQ